MVSVTVVLGRRFASSGFTNWPVPASQTTFLVVIAIEVESTIAAERIRKRTKVDVSHHVSHLM